MYLLLSPETVKQQLWVNDGFHYNSWPAFLCGAATYW